MQNETKEQKLQNKMKCLFTLKPEKFLSSISQSSVSFFLYICTSIDWRMHVWIYSTIGNYTDPMIRLTV